MKFLAALAFGLTLFNAEAIRMREEVHYCAAPPSRTQAAHTPAA